MSRQAPFAQVAQLGRTTDMAYSAKTSADIAENLQLHFVLNKRYPTHMDSLLIDVGADGITAAGNGVTADGVYVGAFNNAGTWTVSSGYQERGLPDSGPHLDDALVAQQLQNVSGSQGYRSFTRCGFETLMDHDERASDSNNSGVITRNLSNATADWFACINPATPAGQGYIAQLFPNSLNGTTPVLPNDVEAIVAVGLGPRSSCIPETMLNAPLYPGNDKSYYGHFVAYFACYKSGERAVLVEQRRIAHDRGQEVVEVMRDSAGQLSDGFQALTRSQGTFHAQALGPRQLALLALAQNQQHDQTGEQRQGQAAEANRREHRGLPSRPAGWAWGHEQVPAEIEQPDL